jgi:hypothetical protein
MMRFELPVVHGEATIKRALAEIIDANTSGVLVRGAAGSV